MNNYNRLTPFKWFILENFPLIDEDFDALTNWQLFCKLGKEINKIINSQNSVGEQMKNVTDAFIALQDYVTNYFDNLDVQDDIDNKLDEMVEQGTLQEIIASYLNSKAVFGFDNVSDLQDSENLIDGSYARTLGFYEKNDGGGSLYKIRTITNDDVIDNMTILPMNNDNTLIAELIIDSNIINPKQFGAYCDNIHDDSDALEACINFTDTLASSNGTWKRTILIPAIMKVTRRIDCTVDQFKMCGTSLNNSRIVFNGPNSYLNIAKSDNSYAYEIEMSDIKIYGDYSQENSLIKFTKCNNVYLTRVETCNGGLNQYNISFINSGIIFMNQCTVTGSNSVGLYPGNRNGIYIKSMGSIFNFTNANCWNLNNLFKFDGMFQHVNIHDNWIECIKSLIEIDCATDMRYMNMKIENNTINTHQQDTNFVPTTFNFISFAMANDTNLFSSTFTINNNTIYMWDVTSINGDSLIYLDGIGASTNSTWDINFNSNVFSGKTLNDLGAYVFYNSNTSFYNRYNVHIKSFTPVNSIDAGRLTNNKKIVACTNPTSSKGFVNSPNGIYLGTSTTENYGNIYYEDGNFYAGYEGTIRQLPKAVTTAFPYVTSSTDLVGYLNDLTSALVNTGIIRRQT